MFVIKFVRDFPCNCAHEFKQMIEALFTCVEGPKLIVVYWVTNNLLNNIQYKEISIETSLVSRVKLILSRS
jgi:hypothetical protein